MPGPTAEVAFGRWTVTCDPLETQLVYERMAGGGAEECGCEPCRNFIAAREQTFPPEARALFASLGIDFCRDAETYHNGRLAHGLHSYGAWFHFLGSLSSGRDALVPTSPSGGTFDLVRLSERFEVGFSTNVALVSPLFDGRPVVQVEIAAEVPWVIGGLEPD